MLSYAGEILYDHYKIDKDEVYQILSGSPSYNALDQPQMVRLQEDLAEALHEEDN